MVKYPASVTAVVPNFALTVTLALVNTVDVVDIVVQNAT